MATLLGVFYVLGSYEMADGRMLKKKISLNEALADLANDTHRLLFTWAIPHLDIEGRISGSPRVFKGTVVPILDHITLKVIREFFQDAFSKRLIAYYEANGEMVIEFPGFKSNQNLRETREAPSKFGPPPDDVWQTPGQLPELSWTTPLEGKRREVKRRETLVCVLDEDFVKFWQAYPRKIAKPDALKAWKKTNGKPPIDRILTVLERQKASEDWQKDGGRFIPHPTTYINKGRWYDEPDDVNISQSTLCSHGIPQKECKVCRDYLPRHNGFPKRS